MKGITQKFKGFNPSLLLILMTYKAGTKIAQKSTVSTLSWSQKMIISAIIDAIDFILGLDIIWPFDIPVLSIGDTLYDIFTLPISIALWKEYGLISLWEIPSATEVGNAIDGFVPTTTIAGLLYKQAHPEVM